MWIGRGGGSSALAIFLGNMKTSETKDRSSAY